VITKGQKPSSRMGHVAALYHSNKMIVFGGKNVLILFKFIIFAVCR
jgi:hypothetical protein